MEHTTLGNSRRNSVEGTILAREGKEKAKSCDRFPIDIEINGNGYYPLSPQGRVSGAKLKASRDTIRSVTTVGKNLRARSRFLLHEIPQKDL